MARGSYNPWGKKSKKGMKIFNSMIKTTYKVGKAATKSSSKSRPASNTSNNGCMVALLAIVFFSVIAIIGMII